MSCAILGAVAGHSGGLNKSGVTANGGMHIRRGSPLPTSVTRLAAATRQVSASVIGVREMLTSLGLLCLLSLMMALLGLVFLLKMSPPPDAIHFVDQVRIVSIDEAGAVYEVSLALCSLAMTLDVCCCLVCATQLLFAARLITASTCSSSNSSRDRWVEIKTNICFVFYLKQNRQSKNESKMFIYNPRLFIFTTFLWLSLGLKSSWGTRPSLVFVPLPVFSSRFQSFSQVRVIWQLPLFFPLSSLGLFILFFPVD